MTSRPLDCVLSADNVLASVEQFLHATREIHPDEEMRDVEITFDKKAKQFHFKGIAAKLEDVQIRQLN